MTGCAMSSRVEHHGTRVPTGCFARCVTVWTLSSWTQRKALHWPHRTCAGGNLASVIKERQQVQMEVWAEATAESVRATLASAVLDMSHRTIVTLNNKAVA